MILTRYLSLTILFAVLFSSFVDAIPPRPNPPRLVNDFTGTLSQAEQQYLEQKLRALNDTTSVQIVVVFVADLDGYDVADYATRLGHNWGIGQKNSDNGIVLLVKPKQASSPGKVNIATGYGIEGLVPDAIANRIIDQEIIPRFKVNDYAGGVNAGIDILTGLVSGQFTAEGYAKGGELKLFHLLPLAFIILIFVVASGRKKKSGIYSGGKDIPFWLLLSMMGSSSRSGSGSFGSFSSGSGGFGGFGGGGFGGGGASGSW